MNADAIAFGTTELVQYRTCSQLLAERTSRVGQAKARHSRHRKPAHRDGEAELEFQWMLCQQAVPTKAGGQDVQTQRATLT